MVRVFLLIAFFVQPALAADDLNDDAMKADEFSVYQPIEEVIIDEELIQKSDWQEPFFVKADKKDRGIASEISTVSKKEETFKSVGSLKVVNEIPYTYPVLTHRLLQVRVLNKVEGKEAKKAKNSKNAKN